MRPMRKLQKLKQGDKVAILSPSFAAPGKWPHVYELGLQRLRDIFGLKPIEFPTTRKIGASKEDCSRDLIAAFEGTTVRGIITSIGGGDQVTIRQTSPGTTVHRQSKTILWIQRQYAPRKLSLAARYSLVLRRRIVHAIRNAAADG